MLTEVSNVWGYYKYNNDAHKSTRWELATDINFTNVRTRNINGNARNINGCVKYLNGDISKFTGCASRISGDTEVISLFTYNLNEIQNIINKFNLISIRFYTTLGTTVAFINHTHRGKTMGCGIAFFEIEPTLPNLIEKINRYFIDLDEQQKKGSCAI